MAELEARGPEPGQHWCRPLTGRAVTLGRTDKSDWQAGWDAQISGKHAVLAWQEGRLRVRKVPEAKNQIFFRGNPAEDFTAEVGDRFVIGKTTFTVQEPGPGPGSDAPSPLAELTCSRHELMQVRFVDASERIEALAALPGMIRYSPSDEQVDRRVVEVLLQGMPRADAAAVVWLNPKGPAAGPEIQVRFAARRTGPAPNLRPSRQLVFEAVRKRRQGVLHSWSAGGGGKQYTEGTDSDWAICVPLPDEPSPGWALYVTGRNPAVPSRSPGMNPQDVEKSDLKFAGLVADVFGALRQVLDLQKRQTILSRVFSPTVLAALARKDVEEVLRRRQTDVTVLFCDLRGSCRIAEDAKRELTDVCDRMSEALSVMTTQIIDKDGVIGDFQGDAAMGFWGWPEGNEADQVRRAARAALAIRKEFDRVARRPNHPLHGFACGIGIAHGPAIAGKLGTFDQLKVSVFGPVVNLAARLESMTKKFRVPILIDANTANELLAGSTGTWARCRRLARVKPFGMDRVFMVYELLPPAHEGDAMREQDRFDCEAALEAFLTGQWPEARRLIERLADPAACAFLKEYMEKRDFTPPDGWDGTVELESK